MALNTQQKRMSAMGHGRPFVRSVFPVATPTEAWRLNVLLAYAGNALSPSILIVDDTFTFKVLPRHELFDAFRSDEFAVLPRHEVFDA